MAYSKEEHYLSMTQAAGLVSEPARGGKEAALKAYTMAPEARLVEVVCSLEDAGVRLNYYCDSMQAVCSRLGIDYPTFEDNSVEANDGFLVRGAVAGRNVHDAISRCEAVLNALISGIGE